MSLSCSFFPSQETNQEVPGWLASLASRGGSYGSSSKRRGGGNRFGGRDFRNDRRGGGALRTLHLLSNTSLAGA